MISICVLLLLQNDDVRQRIAATVVTLPWYRERNFKDVKKVGGLNFADAIVLCVLRTVMHTSSSKLQDSYLASNCYAILLNIAPLLSNI